MKPNYICIKEKITINSQKSVKNKLYLMNLKKIIKFTKLIDK